MLRPRQQLRPDLLSSARGNEANLPGSYGTDASFCGPVVRRNIRLHRQVEMTKTEAGQRQIDMSPELLVELTGIEPVTS